MRLIKLLNYDFGVHGAGEIVAWSRILDDEEALCVLNANGSQNRGADVIVDAHLNQNFMKVVLNTSQAAAEALSSEYTGTHPVGSIVEVKRRTDGTAYVEIRNVGSSEVIVLTNHP